MADSQAAGDLVTAVAGALRGDRESLNRIVTDAQARARGRLREALTPADPNQTVPLPAPVARPVPQPAPDREVALRLKDGRTLRARISPGVARRRDLAAVARASADNTRRTFESLRRQRKAIVALRRSQEALEKKLAGLEHQGDLELVGLLQGFAGLERQVRSVSARTQAVAMSAGVPTPQPQPPGSGRPPLRPLRPQPLDVRQLALRAQIQSATQVVNTVQAAAFGERGRVFSTNNLLLAGNQLFWSLLDPVLQRAGILDAASATLVAALAPIGTLFTGEVLLGGRQHVRFISGISTVPTDGTVVSESLRGRVVEGAWPEFSRRTDVPVTISLADPPGFGTSDVQIRVNQGSVEIRVAPVLGFRIRAVAPVRTIRVAWTVDTGEGDG